MAASDPTLASPTPDRATRADGGATASSFYLPELDGLRAFAVGAVLVHHLLDTGSLPFGLAAVSWGFLGVRLFFVLSGFLITGLLLRGRATAAREATSANAHGDTTAQGNTTGERKALLFQARQFYARRFLRIFPLYYMVIAVLALFAIPPVRDVLAWLLTYTYNVLVARQGYYDENVGHFWSLAVEEQFYLLWPWVVLFAPRRALVPVTLVMTLMGPVYRCLALHFELTEAAIYSFTPSSLDALGLGSLVALLQEGGRAIPRRLCRGALVLGATGAVVLQILSERAPAIGPTAHVVLFDTVVALGFAAIVAELGARSPGRGQRRQGFLASAPLVYLGRRSYGIYVYHLLVLHALESAWARSGVAYPHGTFPSFVLASLLTVGVAALSWRFFEGPLNDLKRHFEYGRAPGPVA